jgi:hypothetical protein
MSALVWGVLLLVVVPLLQVPAVFYLSQYVELEEGERVRPPEGTYVTYAGETEPRETADPADEGTACPRCGADNDPAYQYCQRCAGALT